MSKIVVIGGTGYAGAALVRHAASRGHEVTSISRNAADAAVDRVTYVTGNVTDETFLDEALADADAIISALSPRGELDGRIVEVDRQTARIARANGARLFVVGGFSSLRPSEDEPAGAESADIPEQHRAEITQMNDVLADLKAEPAGLSWTFVSPAQEFGAHVPGEELGRYRIGGEVALVDDTGRSAISATDLARAIVDRIEEDDYHRSHIGVAY